MRRGLPPGRKLTLVVAAKLHASVDVRVGGVVVEPRSTDLATEDTEVLVGAGSASLVRESMSSGAVEEG